MENDIMNVPQPDGRKLTVRNVLLIVWLALCTALFVYFFWINTSGIVSLVTAFAEVGADIGSAVAVRVFLLIASIIVYASVAVLLIPKVISIFRPTTPPRAINYATLTKKILLIVWTIIFSVALICLFVYCIYALVIEIEQLSIYTNRYEVYEKLVAEGDDRYISELENIAIIIQIYKKDIPVCIFLFCLPFPAPLLWCCLSARFVRCSCLAVNHYKKDISSLTLTSSVYDRANQKRKRRLRTASLLSETGKERKNRV